MTKKEIKLIKEDLGREPKSSTVAVNESITSIAVFLGDEELQDSLIADIAGLCELDKTIIRKTHKGVKGYLVQKPVTTLALMGFFYTHQAIAHLFEVKTFVHKGKSYGSSIFVPKPKSLFCEES